MSGIEILGTFLFTVGILRYQCFVGDTQVVIREATNVAIASAVVGDGDQPAGLDASFLVMAGLTITAGWLGKEVLDERQRRGHQKEKPERAREYDVADPNRCELNLLDVSTEPVPIPTLSAKDFDMLCDDLLSGEVSSPTASRSQSRQRLGAACDDRPRSGERGYLANRGLAWMWACLLIGGGFLWSGLSGSASSSRPLIAASTSRLAPIVAASSVPKYETKSIRDIRVGERVLAHNPELSDSERADAIEPDQATWRHIQFLMHKPDGSTLEIELLRPVEWLDEQAEMFVASAQPGWHVADQLLDDDETSERALLGRTIELDLAELGASGPAEVLSITPCPNIEPDTGDDRQVVTATFKHSAGDVLDLHIAGEPQPIGTTANHPFWSEDRQAFIPASQLQVGENLRHADNTITQVTRINPRRGPPVAVYNLEVNAEHVYYVGQDGILVHNNCLTQIVSRWGRPGLLPGDWVMRGPASAWTYLRSFKWQPGIGNKFAPLRSGQSFSVPSAFLRWPRGWGKDGWWKGLFGQRIYDPMGPFPMPISSVPPL